MHLPPAHAQLYTNKKTKKDLHRAFNRKFVNPNKVSRSPPPPHARVLPADWPPFAQRQPQQHGWGVVCAAMGVAGLVTGLLFLYYQAVQLATPTIDSSDDPTAVY